MPYCFSELEISSLHAQLGYYLFAKASYTFFIGCLRMLWYFSCIPPFLCLQQLFEIPEEPFMRRSYYFFQVGGSLSVCGHILHFEV